MYFKYAVLKVIFMLLDHQEQITASLVTTSPATPPVTASPAAAPPSGLHSR